MPTAAVLVDQWALEALEDAHAPREVLQCAEVLLTYRDLLGPGASALIEGLVPEGESVAWMLEQVLAAEGAMGVPGCADACLLLLTGSRGLGEAAGAILGRQESDWYWRRAEWCHGKQGNWTYAWGMSALDAGAWAPKVNAWASGTTLDPRPVRLMLRWLNSADPCDIVRGLGLGALMAMRPGLRGIPYTLAKPRALPPHRDATDLRMWMLRELYCRLVRGGRRRSPGWGAGESREPELDAIYGEAHVPLGWVALALGLRHGWPGKPALMGHEPREKIELNMPDGIRWAVRAAIDFKGCESIWREGVLAGWWLPESDLLGSGQLHGQIALSMDELWRVAYR